MSRTTLSRAFEAAVAQHQAGRLVEAERGYREILRQQPTHADALHMLGVLGSQVGQHDAAVEMIRRAISLRPDFPEAHTNLGKILADAGRVDEAIAHYQRAIELSPQLTDAHNNLGEALRRMGRYDEAAAAIRRALALRPNWPEALNNLGNALKNPAEAMACYERAISLRPNYAAAHNNLANVLREQGRLEEAVQSYQRAIAVNPKFAEAHGHLGSALREQRRFDESLDAFRRAIAIRPTDTTLWSNLLLSLHYHPRYDAAAIFKEHLRWAEVCAEPLRQTCRAHENDRSRERVLRVGYISPDFREHAVGRFLGFLADHDRERVRVVCFSDVDRVDELTKRFKEWADEWHSTVGMSDNAVAELIRRQRIDILVDLAGHTGGNRMLIFARRPAPVQVTYLGYPNTTGQRAIDYRLTDAHADPAGTGESLHAETLVRLPRTAWCFTPPEPSPDVSARPVVQAGHITFGCFNNLAKISPVSIELWSQILKNVPRSKLLIKRKTLRDAATAARLVAAFSEQGIGQERLDLRSDDASYEEHLASYRHVDIALDPFPYHGTTSTCEALWMGVPVVTLARDVHMSRVGVSLLKNVGLGELIAEDRAEYVTKASYLAVDLPRLENLSGELRDRMRQSPLCDAKAFARDIEEKYRWMWSKWCEGEKTLSETKSA